MDEFRIDVSSWALNHGCTMTFDQGVCLFMISAYPSTRTGLIQLSKNSLLQHSKGCAETPKATTVMAAMAILALALRVTPALCRVCENCS